ncbi:MAG: phosphoenolpyruvate--protein phosphotransferase [Burkholderiales bacterium]|nr:phosphoenolpyruvate--protein phosphotransferase [Burkholderiales bacterium]
MSNISVTIHSPLSGVFMDLSLVPDPVFAEKMVGDGFAIDPLENILYAPIDGIVKTIHRAKHAISIESAHGFEILMHIGLETVMLNGEGFEVFVKEGQQVKIGDKLSSFDMGFVSERVVAMLTPVLVTDVEEKNISLEFIFKDNENIIKAGEPAFTVSLSNSKSSNNIPDNTQATVSSDLIVIPNSHGIHARPAAQLSSIARKFTNNEITLIKGEKSANVKSVVSLLSLGVQYQDQVKLMIKGDHSTDIINELIECLTAMQDDENEDIHVKVNSNNSDLTKVENGIYYGVVASSGIALAKLIQQTKVQFNYERFTADIEGELSALTQVIQDLIKELEFDIASLSHEEVAHRNILNAHLMIFTDPELIASAKNKIADGQSAAFAWDKSIEESCLALEATGNELLIERQSDLIDVCDRVLTLLCGEENKVTYSYNEDVILVADNYTPSQIIALNDKVKGLVSVKGGVTSHVSIIARTRGIPLLVGVSKDVLQEASGVVILDTLNTAMLNSKPSSDQIELVKSDIANREEELRKARDVAFQAATTMDGIQISCLGNIGNLEEARLVVANGGEGVGLFRTEFMFLESATAPSEEFQLSEYREINHVLANKPFVIRTLDVGGDKKIPYLEQSHEENPMLGVRGVRLCLANIELFKTQLRAILRSATDNIKIMVPMISKITEYRAVKRLIEEVKVELGISQNVSLGIMVEVPSVAFTSEIFAREVDFMSIGTNDLTQYVLAVDREHTELAREIDHLHPAVIAAIAFTVSGASKHNTPLSICGLMASEKLAIPVLLGLGVKTLSMTASSIPENKAFIRTLNVEKCQEIAKYCLELGSAVEVREYLKSIFTK